MKNFDIGTQENARKLKCKMGMTGFSDYQMDLGRELDSRLKESQYARMYNRPKKITKKVQQSAFGRKMQSYVIFNKKKNIPNLKPLKAIHKASECKSVRGRTRRTFSKNFFSYASDMRYNARKKDFSLYTGFNSNLIHNIYFH